jgi:predicted nucleic acid-binding protein
MRIYFDTCCLNRPFDDQSQNRIHLESEAIIIILNKLYKGELEWIGSEVLDIEVENIPNIEKRRYLTKILEFVHESLQIEDDDLVRAKQLKEIGFKSFDSMHIACAERGNVEILLTTDDKLLKLAERSKDVLNIQVSNPLTWLTERL